jgi:hypothetical protein
MNIRTLLAGGLTTQPQTPACAGSRTTPVHPQEPTMSENIKFMLAEIQKMKAYCLANYEKGYDTMVECWTDADYEQLFYTTNPNRDTRKFQPEVRCSFDDAWKRLHSIASVFEERRADARNSAF